MLVNEQKKALSPQILIFITFFIVFSKWPFGLFKNTLEFGHFILKNRYLALEQQNLSLVFAVFLHLATSYKLVV